MGTVVSAQYRLPHHLWVDYSVIGSTFDTYIGPIRVKIITPTRSSSSVAETVRPDVSGVPDDAWSPADEWSKTYAGFGTDNKTALLRIGLELSEGARTIPSYLPYPENPETEAQRSEKIGSITAACMDEWFTRIAEWTSVVTGEDVNPRHPVFDATVIGGGFEYWSGSSWQGGGFRFTMPEPRALTSLSLQAILDRVADFERPPLEHLLICDSVGAIRREDPRKAVLDAATAVEVCLIRLVDEVEKSTGVGCKGKDSRGLIPRSRWLEGNSASYAAEPGLAKLADARNGVIHAGDSPSHDEVNQIVRTAIAIVGQHGRSPDPRQPTATP